jgi:hypothetical protein
LNQNRAPSRHHLRRPGGQRAGFGRRLRHDALGGDGRADRRGEPAGGLGSIAGIAVCAILLSEIDNALIVAAVPPQYNMIVVGPILIAAVAIDHLRRERLYRVRR